MSSAPSQHVRFGVALSGGGFRASFFHLGVLRRLAELDLLRHVTDLSTVSGGSIVAAHYYLLFKQLFEKKKGVLEKADYLRIVTKLEQQFAAGNEADLRNRLLMKPWNHVFAMVSGRGYGGAMARLYTKHFYKQAAKDTDTLKALGADTNPNGIPLHQAVTVLPEQSAGPRLTFRSSSYPNTADPERTLCEFNLEQDYATIPRLIMNATCLNTGGPFHFMLNEVGGPEMGYVRYDELFLLLQYKIIICSFGNDPFNATFLEEAIASAITDGRDYEQEYPELPQTAFKSREAIPPHTASHLSFYLAARQRLAIGEPVNGDSWVPPNFELVKQNAVTKWLAEPAQWPVLRQLHRCDFGTLRRVKVAAWNLLDKGGWSSQDTRDGWTRDHYETELWNALGEISKQIVERFKSSTADFEPLAYFALDLYYFRSAEAIHFEAPYALRKLTLSHAVAASANFPPVFTPFKIFHLFDDRLFECLALTDGGVHDNQGGESLLDAGCTHIFISDAGGLVRPEFRAPEARVPMMDRIINVLMGGVRRALLEGLEQRSEMAKLAKTGTGIRSKHLRDALRLEEVKIFHMTTNPADGDPEGLTPFAAAEVAELRTDLDAFNQLEREALRYQGYQLCDRFARSFAVSGPLQAKRGVPDAASPCPDLPAHPTSDQMQRLRAGAHLTGRFSVAFPWIAAVVSILVGLALLEVMPHKSEVRASFSYLIDRLDHFTSLGDKLRAIPFIADLRQAARDFAWAFNYNVVTLLCGLWAVVLIAGEVRRWWNTNRKHVLVKVGNERWKNNALWVLRLLRRNALTLVCASMFAITLHPKWLIGVLPLWSIPMSLLFAAVHYVAMPLWMLIGQLPDVEERAARMEALQRDSLPA